MSRKVYWNILGLEYSSVGYVYELKFFGFTVASKCGVINRLFGVEWRDNDR